MSQRRAGRPPSNPPSESRVHCGRPGRGWPGVRIGAAQTERISLESPPLVTLTRISGDEVVDLLSGPFHNHPASDVRTASAFVARGRWTGPGPSGPAHRRRHTKNLKRGDRVHEDRYDGWAVETPRRSARRGHCLGTVPTSAKARGRRRRRADANATWWGPCRGGETRASTEAGRAPRWMPSPWRSARTAAGEVAVEARASSNRRCLEETP